MQASSQFLAGATGNGNSAVQFTVAPNTGAARTGTLTVAGATFTITQAAGIVVPPPALAPPNAQSPAGGQVVDTLTPTLIVANAAATGSVGSVTYRFEVSDQDAFPDGVRTIAADAVAQGNGNTAWTVPQNLAPGTMYFWRVRANGASVASAFKSRNVQDAVRLLVQPVGDDHQHHQRRRHLDGQRHSARRVFMDRGKQRPIHHDYVRRLRHRQRNGHLLRRTQRRRGTLRHADDCRPDRHRQSSRQQHRRIVQPARSVDHGGAYHRMPVQEPDQHADDVHAHVHVVPTRADVSIVNYSWTVRYTYEAVKTLVQTE